MDGSLLDEWEAKPILINRLLTIFNQWIPLMINLPSRILPAFAVILALGVFAPAHAVTLDWDLDVPDLSDGVVDDGDQSVNGGIAITFSNIIGSDGGDFGNVDTDGIFFSNTGRFSEVSQLDITFDSNVIFEEYDIDFENARRNSGFVISGVNGTSGLNLWGRTGRFAFDMGTIPVFLAGEAYTLTHDLSGRRFSQIDEIVVSVAPVPLPAGGLLLLGALATGGLVLRRRKRAP